MCPLVYPLSCHEDRKCCLYLNEQICGKWLVLHEHCYTVSLARVTWCWLCKQTCGKVFGFSSFCSLSWLLMSLGSEGYSPSVVSQFQVLSVFLSLGKLAKHYRFHSFSQEWKNVNIHCEINHLFPQCLYLLLNLFCFPFEDAISRLQSLPPYTERVEIVDFNQGLVISKCSTYHISYLNSFPYFTPHIQFV